MSKWIPEEDQDNANKLVKMVFPGLDGFQLNSTHISVPVSTIEDRKVCVLLYGDDQFLWDLMREEDQFGEMDIKVSLKKNSYGIGKDLIFRFDFYTPTGNPIYTTVVPGDESLYQKMLVDSLSKVNKIDIWIVDKNKEVFSFIITDWKFDDYPIFNELTYG